MDNLNAFENVVEYLEKIISSSDEVDYSVISQIASCFEGKDNFQYLIGKYVERAAPVPEKLIVRTYFVSKQLRKQDTKLTLKTFIGVMCTPMTDTVHRWKRDRRLFLIICCLLSKINS